MDMPLFDVCAGRHGGNRESVAANYRHLSGRAEQRGRVFRAVRAAGEGGITCRELAEAWGIGMHRISGRFTELRIEGRIARKRVRAGCAVYVEVQPGEWR